MNKRGKSIPAQILVVNSQFLNVPIGSNVRKNSVSHRYSTKDNARNWETDAFLQLSGVPQGA